MLFSCRRIRCIFACVNKGEFFSLLAEQPLAWDWRFVNVPDAESGVVKFIGL